MARIASVLPPPVEHPFWHRKRALVGRFRYLASVWGLGILALAFASWACFELDLSFTTTALIYLTIIVALSLMDSFISSAVFSVVAVGCLEFFFVDPIYSFDVTRTEHITTQSAFLATSLAVTGLVRRLRRLGEEQREQVQLLDLTHDAVVVRDMRDVITYWNRGAEELYGWTREEAVGKVIHELLQTVFPAPLEQITATLLRVGRWEGEFLHKKRDGTEVSVVSRWSLQRDDGGRPLRTLETNTDVTERKRAEDALRRTQETYLAEAQQLSHTGSFGWNVANGEIFWSRETFRIFGYDSQTKPSLDMMRQRAHPDDRALLERILDAAANDQEDFDVELRLLMPDGSVKHLHVVAHGVRDEPGKVQFMGALMDITGRRKAEDALRHSEQRYRHLFHYMPVALLHLNARSLMTLFEGLNAESVTDLGAHVDRHPEFLRRAMDALVVDEVNERTIQLLGARDAAELAGPVARFWQARPDTFRRALEAEFRGEPAFEEETKIVALDGRTIDVMFTQARPGPGSELGMLLVGLIDISERVSAQEALQRLQAEFAHAARISMLGELTASIAHEVNQPLAALKTNGEVGLRWLNRPEPNVAKARELMQRIIDDARRAADIIERIRALAAGQAPQQRTLSLHDVIEESVSFLRNELQSKGVSISLDLTSVPPRVIGDRTQLQQVIVNLAINAAQAMAQAGTARRTLAIRTAISDPGTLRCTMEDSGPGIDANHLSRLFDSFFTTKESGMGMGLPISRSIIEAHGGQIRVDNESTYGGARFSFTLPAAADAAD